MAVFWKTTCNVGRPVQGCSDSQRILAPNEILRGASCSCQHVGTGLRPFRKARGKWKCLQGYNSSHRYTPVSTHLGRGWVGGRSWTGPQLLGRAAASHRLGGRFQLHPISCLCCEAFGACRSRRLRRELCCMSYVQI